MNSKLPSYMSARGRHSFALAAIAGFTLFVLRPVLAAAPVPPPSAPTPISASPSAPVPISAVPISPSPSAPAPISPSPSAPVPISPSPSAPAPAATAPQVQAPAAARGCQVVRPGDQLWLVSTRCMGCAAGNAEPALSIQRYDEATGWQVATLKDFLATDNPAIPTDVYVHGNFVYADDAVSNGMTVYRQLTGNAREDRAVRFVIWSWPTDEPRRHRVEAIREHSYRADTDAWYLGWFLGQINHRVPLGLAGYSFGARVVTGAVHLLGSGNLLGMQLPAEELSDHRTIRVVLLAAAEDCNWLSPRAANSTALAQIEKMLMLNNSCDDALRLYPHLDRCSRCEALGYIGLGGDHPNVEQIDVCCMVGSEHNWAHYFCNETLDARMRPYLFLEAVKP